MAGNGAAEAVDVAAADDGDAQRDNSPQHPPQPSSSAPTDLSTTIKSTADRILHFLSTASNETLGACIVGLGATTYLVLGRVGLVLIGAVGGVVLHASWEGRGQDEIDKQSEYRRRREIGLDVARRVLEWRSSQAKDARTFDISEAPPKATDFSDFPKETAAALNVLTDAVIRDYVKWWYSPILPMEEGFPTVSQATLSSFLLSISNNVARKRPADSFLEFVTNSSSIIIVFLNEISTAVWASPSAPVANSIDTYLQLKPESNLANIIDTHQQERKFLAVSDDILATHLDHKVYSCPPAQVFLRQVLAQLILNMTLQRCSQSDWINEWIVYLLEETEPELPMATAAPSDGSMKNASAHTTSGLSEASFQHSPADETANHKGTRTRAEEAMEDAMREAQRLTQLMAEEDAKRNREQELASPTMADDTSDTTTHYVPTPTSSQSDQPPQTAELQALQSEQTEQPGLETPSIEETEPPNITNFDQAIAPKLPTALLDYEGPPPGRREVLTLHKARVSIFDDGGSGDRKPLRSKPTIDYMIQIEPASSNFPGWMIARTYPDFEKLHEVLRRISTISGAVTFTEAHAQLPGWKGRTKAQLTQDLDRYLMDAIQFEPLAESEGMKRFLDKERGMTKSPRAKSAFWSGPAALENMSKGVFEAISKAPKNVAGGGKAVFSGVTNALGSGQVSRSGTSPLPETQHSTSVSSLGRNTSGGVDHGMTVSNPGSRPSTDSTRTSTSETSNSKQSVSNSTFTQSRSSLDDAAEYQPLPRMLEETPPTPSTPQTPKLNLPPPPSDIPDDYLSPSKQAGLSAPSATVERTVPDTTSNGQSLEPTDLRKPHRGRRKDRDLSPLNEKETQVTIELMFAVVNELYTLSSAWTLRRTLLNAARSYLLRPGNPQLESIRLLMQETVLDMNTSDSGIASHILKIRENALPTEEELDKWPKPRTEEEKEKLRVRARRLIMKKGMPQALTSVMGMAASGEALGRVFDALQVEKVARGLMFGLMLQGVRALTQ